MKKRGLLFVWIIISCACHDEMQVRQEVLRNAEGVAVFLAENMVNASHPTASLPLQIIALQPTPWIAPEDIASYDFSTHLIYLREGVTLSESNFPGSGIFVVVANGEKRYAGFFLPGHASFIPLGKAAIATQPKFYPEDVVHIDFLTGEPAYWDPRNDEIIKETLIANDQFQPGISCTLTAVSGGNDQITYQYELRNLGSTPLYVLDPDNMGEALFHYFTHGVVLQNGYNIYWAEHRQMASPDPVNHWEEGWFTLLESNDVLRRTVHLDGFPEVEKGMYNCSFRFPSVHHIERSERKLEKGQIWLGEVSDSGEFELN